MSPLLKAFTAAPLAMALFMSASAGAQESSTSVTAADALFEQGRAAMSSGDWDSACERFRESNRLDPAVGTRLNLADCEEKRGHVATAWSLFRSAAAELSNSDDRQPIANQRARSLEPRVPKLVLVARTGAPNTMRARVSGVEFTKASFGIGLPMDPGHYEVAVDAPGYQTRTFEFDLAEGDLSPIEVSPGSLSSTQPTEERATSSAGDRRTWAYVLGGVGAAGLVTGTVTGILTLEKKSTAEDNCNDALKRCNAKGKQASDQGRTFGAVSAVGFVVGALGAGGATFLWFTDSSAKSSVAPGASSFNPEFGPDGAFLSYEHPF